MVEHGKAQEEEENIDHAVDGRGAQPGPGRERGQNHGQAGYAAHGEVVGKFEEIHADGDQNNPQCHEENVPEPCVP